MDKRSGLLLGLMVTACLGGCASVHKDRDDEADLARLSRWLPGTYDNSAQVKSDLAKGVTPPHDAVELSVVTVDSIAVGRSAFYLQETAADDPMRVFSQHVVTFSVGKKGIVQTVNNLTDPLRWRNGQREPDIFESMTPRDFKQATGCDITWTREVKDTDQGKKKKLSKEDALKEAEHSKFIGTNDSKHCEMTSHLVMGLVNMELRGEIAANEIDLAEVQYDSDGKPLQAATGDPFYRFRREGK
jgi:uncharacterized protein YceK